MRFWPELLLPQKAAEIEVETSTTLYAKIDAPDVVVRKARTRAERQLRKSYWGRFYEVAASGRSILGKDQHRGRRGALSSNRNPDREDKGKSG